MDLKTFLGLNTASDHVVWKTLQDLCDQATRERAQQRHNGQLEAYQLALRNHAARRGRPSKRYSIEELESRFEGARDYFRAERERERLERKAKAAADESFDAALKRCSPLIQDDLLREATRKRGEQLHRAVQDQLDEAAKAQEIEAILSGARGQAVKQEYLESLGLPSEAAERSTPADPLEAARARVKIELDERAKRARPGPIEHIFDEPEGECRKSAESASKPRLELVPFDVIEEIAEVLTYGANKYEANNWTRGARWGRYFAALLRHGFAWWRGEDRDPETGFSHLAHLGCNLVFLMSYQRHGWGEDDRFFGPDDKPFTKHDGTT